jgi:DNA polymerase-4
MDAFYASVEQLDDPSLRGKPVIVGGPLRRGVVSAASYEVRPYGVRSAMPMAEAMRRCPHAIVVPGRMDRYVEVSGRVFAILRRYTPLVEGLSVDEAFLDATASRSLFGDGEAIARRIKEDIRREIGLTASAGVSPSKFVSKIASDLKKPDGLVVVREDEVRGLLAPLPIERMWGVGPKAAAELHAHGFETIGDLARASADDLTRRLGSWGATVHELANGIDERPVVPGEAAKSIGAEETFDRDLHARVDLETALLAQSRRVARRLVDGSLCGTVVTVKLKYADFSLKTRQTVLEFPVADTDSIYRAACALLDRFPATKLGTRLTGVSIGGLMPGPPPPTLFRDDDKLRRERLERTVHAIEERFGKGGITRAALLDRDSEEPQNLTRRPT